MTEIMTEVNDTPKNPVVEKAKTEIWDDTDQCHGLDSVEERKMQRPAPPPYGAGADTMQNYVQVTPSLLLLHVFLRTPSVSGCPVSAFGEIIGDEFEQTCLKM